MKLLRLIPWILLATSSAAAQQQVELLVDASATMSRQLADHNTRIAALRDVLTTLEAVLPAASDELELALRVFGGAHQLTDELACSDQQLLMPFRSAAGAPLASHAAALVARGRSPLAAALSAAAGDFGDGSSQRTLVLITDGWDSCGGDVWAALELYRSAEPAIAVQVIGIALNRDLRDMLPSWVTVQVVQNGAEMATALAKIMAALHPLELQPRALAFALVPPEGAPEAPTIDLSSTITGNSIPVPADAAPVVSAGVYAVRVSAPGVDLEYPRVVVDRSTPPTLELPVPSLGDLTIGEPEEQLEGATTVALPFSGLSHEGARLCLASQRARGYDERWCVPLEPGQGVAQLNLPPTAGIYEARLHLPSTVGGSVIVSRVPVPVLPSPAAWIDAPASVESGDPVAVVWSAVEQPGDLLLLAPSDAEPEDFVAWWPAPASKQPLDIFAPTAGCEYEFRYLSTASMGFPARTTMLVIEPPAELRGPRQVRIHDPFEVRWRGPDAANDYITMVPEGAEDGSYGQLAETADGDPASLVAPSRPGLYELRYMSGHGATVLDRVPITVLEIPATLDAPARVAAGSRFTVHWTGPDRSGDFVGLYRQGANVARHEDFAVTTLGSPTSLAAPFSACSCEIRYVSGADGTILASRPITVR